MPTDDDLEDHFRAMTRQRNLVTAILFGLAVTLVLIVFYMNARVLNNLSKRDSDHTLVIDAVNENQRLILCFTETQADWYSAISDVVAQSVDESTDVSDEALARLAMAAEDMASVEGICSPPDAVPTLTPDTTDQGGAD